MGDVLGPAARPPPAAPTTNQPPAERASPGSQPDPPARSHRKGGQADKASIHASCSRMRLQHPAARRDESPDGPAQASRTPSAPPALSGQPVPSAMPHWLGGGELTATGSAYLPA